MGWNVSHGANRWGEMRRSYTSMSNLARHLERVLDNSDWQKISYLFNQRDPFTVCPADAANACEVLRAAAKKWRMPRGWAADARELADAAERAANTRQNWTWR